METKKADQTASTSTSTSTSTTQGACDDFCAPTAIDDDSLAVLIEACSELSDSYDLEQCPGRAGWLSEIIEEFKALIAGVDPSQASERLTQQLFFVARSSLLNGAGASSTESLVTE